MAQEVFRRREEKYVLTPEQQTALLDMIEPYLRKEHYFKGTNCSLYFDTDDWYLLLRSLEKPLYREKVRVRSYGVPNLNDTVFLEIKKKFKKIGSKRRVPVKLADLYNYLDGHGTLKTDNPQIEAELDYCFQHYQLKPKLMIIYDRLSYCGKDDATLRVTFDFNVRGRADNLRLEQGDQGRPYFQHGEIVMEVKATHGYPMWFTQALSKLQLYPTSFTKYGRVAMKLINNKEEQYVQ